MLQGLDDTMTATGVDRLDDTTTALIPLTARWDDGIDRKIDAVSSHARRLEGSADFTRHIQEMKKKPKSLKAVEKYGPPPPGLTRKTRHSNS